MTKLGILAVVASALTISACVNGTAQDLNGPAALTAAGAAAPAITPAPEIKRHAISGTVASMVKPYHVIAQARIEVTKGVDAGRSVDSDAAGAFSLTSVTAGSIEVTITRPGYEPWVETVPLFSDQMLAAKLMPITP